MISPKYNNISYSLVYCDKKAPFYISGYRITGGLL